MLDRNLATWDQPEEEEEHAFMMERANATAKRVLGRADRSTRGGHGGATPRHTWQNQANAQSVVFLFL